MGLAGRAKSTPARSPGKAYTCLLRRHPHCDSANRVPGRELPNRQHNRMLAMLTAVAICLSAMSATNSKRKQVTAICGNGIAAYRSPCRAVLSERNASTPSAPEGMEGKNCHTVTEGSEEEEDLNTFLESFPSGRYSSRVVNGSFKSSIHPNHAFTIRLAEAVNVAATNQSNVSVDVC